MESMSQKWLADKRGLWMTDTKSYHPKGGECRASKESKAKGASSCITDCARNQATTLEVVQIRLAECQRKHMKSHLTLVLLEGNYRWRMFYRWKHMKSHLKFVLASCTLRTLSQIRKKYSTKEVGCENFGDLPIRQEWNFLLGFLPVPPRFHDDHPPVIA
ncbi:hypothetical protein LINPERHAP1_LOCUS10628 [Linum perenne]